MSHALSFIVLAGLGLSVVLQLWQWMAALRFPIDQPAPARDSAPPLTILKPLKGMDAETDRCLASWLEQDYPGKIQVLFGVASQDDPVCDLVRNLIARHPQTSAELIVCPESTGANAKVSTLAQLERRALHDLFVISDADVLAPPGLLRDLAVPLADASVGLVTCLYRAANPSTLAMRWEAIAVNADFWTQVLQSRSLRPLDFALGAVMAFRRKAFESAGGFQAIRDYLADDYQIGNRIARGGHRIVLSNRVVEGWEAPSGWRAVWRHQLRWSRTFRFCTPVLYFFSVSNNVTLWALLAVLVAPEPPVAGLAMGAVLLRMAIASHSERLFTGSWRHLAYAWLIPVKDLLQTAVWALAFLGNRVTWRGRVFRVIAGGKLVPCETGGE